MPNHLTIISFLSYYNIIMGAIMENKILKFKSKKGWPILITYILFIAAIVFQWVFPYTGEELAIKITATVMMSFVIAIFTWVVCSTYYILADNFLICVYGPIKSRVFYNDITSIKSSRNWWASPALSTDRVAIYRGKNFFNAVFVSPTFKDFFIKELQKKVEDTTTKKLKNEDNKNINK